MITPVSLVTGALDVLIAWSQFSEARPMSRKQLRRMTDLELEEAYQHHFVQVLQFRQGDQLLSRSEAKTSEDKCVFIFDEMSRRVDGKGGPKYRRLFRKQLRKELKAKAKGKSEW